MAVKKKDETPVTNSNINTNNNTNNVNVNVKVEHPKAPRRTNPPKKSKPNWVLRAFVIGLIGLALSLVGYYVKRAYDGGNGQPPSVHNGAPSISGTKQ